MRDRERQRHRQREKQAPCGEPDAALDPRTPGSCPELKAGAKPLSYPGVPLPHILRLSVKGILPCLIHVHPVCRERELGFF